MSASYIFRPGYEDYGKKGLTVSHIIGIVSTLVHSTARLNISNFFYEPDKNITLTMQSIAESFFGDTVEEKAVYVSKRIPEKGNNVSIIMIPTTTDKYAYKVKLFDVNIYDVDYTYMITNPNAMVTAIQTQDVPSPNHFKYIYDLVTGINKLLDKNRYIQLNELERRYLSLFCALDLFVKSTSVKSYDVVNAWSKYLDYSKRKSDLVLRQGMVEDLSKVIDDIFNSTDLPKRIERFFADLRYVAYANLGEL